MENLNIKATKYTPEIVFDCENAELEIRGESYPENIAEFYAPVFVWVEKYLKQLDDREVTVNMELIYFNSSSSKIFLDFFELLDEAAENEKKITVNWIYDADDDDTLEFGEEFQEDFEFLTFILVQKKA